MCGRPSRLKDAIEHPARDVTRIALPPGTYVHEKEKIEKRWPAAVKYIAENELNEFFDGEAADIGIVMQGGMYNTALRGLEVLGLADAFGKAEVPLYVLNVTYPLIDAEFVSFCAGKKAILIVEEGQPDFIEQAVNTILRRADIQTKVHGKDMLADGGRIYRRRGARRPQALRRALSRGHARPSERPVEGDNSRKAAMAAVNGEVQPRPPSFCTGCPGAADLHRDEARRARARHAPRELRHRLPSVLDPAALQYRRRRPWAMASAARGPRPSTSRPTSASISIMGDGGFWHNGLASSVGNAVFNKSDNVIIVVDNGYTAATGGQDILSSFLNNPIRSTQNSIEKAVRGVGVDWARTLTSTYDVAKMRDTLKEALTTPEKGPKVIVAQSECMLNKQRRVRPLMRAAIERGERVVRERFGVDADTCTGDHSCIRLSGCPSLTIAPNPDPLRKDPVTKVINSCVGCGLCGEVAHAAVLCPSFYRASIIENPTPWDRFKARLRDAVIGLPARLARKAAFA